jgi:ABC-2 type transport system permease protein
MSAMNALWREARLMLRDRAVWAWGLVLLCLSTLAVVGGLWEVAHQRSSIERLLAADRADRTAVLQAQKDWGGAAYASFHLTYDPPSDFAFAANGRRDDAAWKHRVRMLALEGQIHERDAGHPVLALVGRFDFAFFAAFVLPLALIVLLHDLRASERQAGRHDLLLATAGHTATLWHLRAGLRSAWAYAWAVLPLVAGAVISGTAAGTWLAACGLLLLYTAFWAVLCAAMAAWQRPGEVILASLLGLWALLAVVLPALGRQAIDRAVPLPSGGQIVLTQREAVNAAWDLPKASTMTAFTERHPEWAAFAAVERPFEWKWYYAFQQVGDQRAEALSAAHTQGRKARDQLAARWSVLAPPVWFERSLQSLAGTDVNATLAYEAQVRAFHAALRKFYYPKLFRNEAFDPKAFSELPQYKPAR